MARVAPGSADNREALVHLGHWPCDDDRVRDTYARHEEEAGGIQRPGAYVSLPVTWRVVARCDSAPQGESLMRTLELIGQLEPD
jgi:hypothetical protein